MVSDDKNVSTSRDLAERVVVRHGGMEHWQDAGAIAVTFQAGGLAFKLKGQKNALDAVEATFDTAMQTVQLRANGKTPWEYEINTSDGLVAAVDSLHASSLLGKWSTDQIGAFTASAMWTYLHVPYVLLDPRVKLTSTAAHDGLTRLVARFPREMATHSPVQSFLIDDDHLIRQHDYTALAFSGLAKAAQTLDGYRELNGFLVATRRRVTPRIAGRPAPGPTLVWIRIDDVRAERGR